LYSQYKNDAPRHLELILLCLKGFWRWCMLNIVIWFLDSIHRPVFKRIKVIKTQRFGDWICLRPQVDRAG
jgi:hypothetical protein